MVQASNILNTTRLALTLVVAALLASCGGGGGGGSDGGSTVTTQGTPGPEISWHSAAKPLIDRYCSNCHVDGGLAPFPLTTYEQVYNKRSALAFSLEAETMPPVGFAQPEAEEVDVLLQWVEAGAPEGDPDQAPYGKSSPYTYHGDTRAIIEKNCVTCHVDGGVAPFPLDSYQKVKDVAAAAAFSVENGTMPPWPPTMGYSRMSHERVLAPEDDHKLRSWLAGDLKEGDPADYVAPQVEPPPEIDFNIRLPLPVAYTPVLRPDDHRCFVMDWPLDEFSYVTSVDVIPDQVAEVHHVIVNIIEPQDTHHYRNAGGEDGRPGYYCLGSGGLPGAPLPRQIGGWVPGALPGSVPEGTGMGIHPDSLLVVQMHYNTLVAEPTPDQSTILIATQDEVERPASGFLYTNPLFLRGGVMTIPAGDPDVHHGFAVPGDVLMRLFGSPAGIEEGEPWVIHNGFIHMHNLGKTARTTLRRADGTEQVIIDIRDWDFNWQSNYDLAEELLVQPGDWFELTCSWDNSAENQVIVDGVQQAPRDVDWGDGTGDEMCLTNLYVTKPEPGRDYTYKPSVHVDTPEHRQIFEPGALVPLELLFNNFTLHEPGEHGDAGHHDAHGGDHSQVYEGHYHVYLDTDDDDAEHLTAWDANYFYQLPEDIAPGLHELRVSLRGTDHHALGIEDTVTIEVADTVAAQSDSLVDVNDWSFQSEAEDSRAAHRPASVDCPDNSWYNEDGALEVETGFCNYLALAQPSKTAIANGDTLHLVLWHGNLSFGRPATGHVAITIDGNALWEETVEIPANADIYDLRLPLDFSAPQGSKVEFHLHNHGYNTWTLLQLEIER